MKVCLQKGGPEIGSPATIMDELRAATEVCQAGWEQRLRQNPGAFRRVEREIKRHFDRGADQFTAAVLARLAGCRVAVQIDGGRVRVRENKKRQASRRKGQRKKLKTPWREPKAVIIFVFDEQGKMIRRDRQPLIDGTLLGPDHLAELQQNGRLRLRSGIVQFAEGLRPGQRFTHQSV